MMGLEHGHNSDILRLNYRKDADWLGGQTGLGALLFRASKTVDGPLPGAVEAPNTTWQLGCIATDDFLDRPLKQETTALRPTAEIAHIERRIVIRSMGH